MTKHWHDNIQTMTNYPNEYYGITGTLYQTIYYHTAHAHHVLIIYAECKTSTL